MEPGPTRIGRFVTTSMRAYGTSCGGAIRCNRAAPAVSQKKRCSANSEYCRFVELSWRPVRESAVKPVGKPDAGNPHVGVDERGWETGRRSGVSARAHPRLYKRNQEYGSDSRRTQRILFAARVAEDGCGQSRQDPHQEDHRNP